MNDVQNRHLMAEYVDQILAKATERMYGVDDVIRLCLVALYTEGHVLLEGNPGLGKTELVKSLSDAFELPWGRIQFTPDLMPTDITGTSMPSMKDGKVELSFQPGPIFTSLLLADEINRATPKTQSAMLEAMAEWTVTVPGTDEKSYRLDQADYRAYIRSDDQNQIIQPLAGRPFLVLATQNPIDHEGTYDLPEAQSDRFMFKILMPLPDKSTLAAILEKVAGRELGVSKQHSSQNDHLNLDAYKETVTSYGKIKTAIRGMEAVTPVRTHIDNLFFATNGHFDKLVGIKKTEMKQLENMTTHLRFGLGPRAAIAMLKGAKAWTYLFDGEVTKADGPALAKVILPILRHRVRFKYEWDKSSREKYPDVDQDRLPDYFLKDYCVAAAPTKNGPDYQNTFKNRLDEIINAEGY